ncbi:glucose-6-phosphate isomerase [Niveibacterium sp. COAC-50]|uniref:glucose-6-phosphate isomerase n=1 Tax=Niveibacterium sp. COAC-50 TaxID=2729384 RepID=UPI001553CB00|nr:glucose-6-phosphate isomerase [Niveibacterium sp. COAC-50]
MNPSSTGAWKALAQHAEQWKKLHLREVFSEDPARAQRYVADACGIQLDYSKNRVSDETLALLRQLADETGVQARRDAMFRGEKINSTENRAVLHVALRNRSNTPITVDGENVMPGVNEVLERMFAFADTVRSGAWKGRTGESITDVVNIGIGGSDLGPLMVCEALKPYAHDSIKMHFVSNVDGAQIAQTLRKLNPATTLFIIASKTFTTIETLTNAHTARDWFLASGASEADIAKHFVAVSTNGAAVSKFGISTDNMFGFWDWVGGRYSLWSAIGLPIVLSIGPDNFKALLGGAHAMDEHFRTAPAEKNLPMLLGLIGVWYANFLGSPSVVIAPYNQNLHRLPAYLQQLDMESNGKGVRSEGDKVDYATGPIIWGEPGINGQHAYFQLLHQGTHLIPLDFILALEQSDMDPKHHAVLIASCFAQAAALMRGKTPDEVRAELDKAGVTGERADMLVKHRTFDGNRPSNMMLLDKLDPAHLGALIALYEHKVFVQGAVWGINSYDQWGVELGKQLASGIERALKGGGGELDYDASTQRLIGTARSRLSLDR